MLVFYSLLLFFFSHVQGMEESSTEKTKRAILKNPLTFVKAHIAHQAFFVLEQKQKNIDPVTNFKEYAGLIAKYKKINPLIELGECFAKKCPLTRLAEPDLRDGFAHMVAKRLASDLKEKNNIQFVSFGSGDLLHDAIIYTNALDKITTDCQLTIHNIDPQEYQFSAPYCDLTLQDRKIHPDTFSNETMISLIAKSTKKSSANVKSSLECVSSKNNSLLEFLKTAFPQVSTDIYIHQNAQSYLQYIKREIISPPDIIAACDVDEPQLGNKSLPDFKLLIEQGMPKPKSSALILGRSGDKNTKALVRIWTRVDNNELEGLIINLK